MVADLDAQTRIVRRGEASSNALAERIALFAVVMKQNDVGRLLSGLADPLAAAARSIVEQAARWPSGKRQARVSLEFGHRADQHDRLARLMAEAPPPLRVALCAQMNASQRARQARLAGHAVRPLPGRAAFAARLVREATR